MKGCTSLSARLDEQHARAAVLAQPVGQHASGGAPADDDVVVSFLHDQAVAGSVT